jgi:hypothetical protein
VRVEAVVRRTLCVHANVPDLTFLNPVHRLLDRAGGHAKQMKLTDPRSHIEARAAIAAATNALIVIFAHGGSSYVRGGQYRDRMSRNLAVVERFIELPDMSLFNGKAVFCLSCDSNGLAETSLAAGAIGFVGFDDIPYHRTDADGRIISGPKFTQAAQGLIAAGVEATLIRFIDGRLTLDESLEFMKRWLYQMAVQYVRTSTLSDKREVAASLLKIKDGACYHGVCGIRFLSSSPVRNAARAGQDPLPDTDKA